VIGINCRKATEKIITKEATIRLIEDQQSDSEVRAPE
jgi:hypothetical protein